MRCYSGAGVTCAKRRLKRTAVPSERLPVLSTHDAHKLARAQRLRASRSERQQRRAEAAQAAQLRIHVSSTWLPSSGPICACKSVEKSLETLVVLIYTYTSLTSHFRSTVKTAKMFLIEMRTWITTAALGKPSHQLRWRWHISWPRLAMLTPRLVLLDYCLTC